jgi:glycosyltransferase involved in cell wall biosynthesis
VNPPGRPLRLALVTRYYPPAIGGAEKVLSYLANALALEGAEVTVLTSRMPRWELPPYEEVPVDISTEDKAGRARARLKIVRLETSERRFWGTWRYMDGIQRWFRNSSIDLAYVSMLKHDAYVTIGAGRRLGFPVVVRPEGAGSTGDVAWQSRGNFGRLIARRCRAADAFVAISAPIEDELRQALHLGTMRGSMWQSAWHVPQGPRIAAIPNGVPVPPIRWQRPPDYRKNGPHAVFVGRLATEKGLDTLLNAWPSVRASFPEARLTLIGEGPQQVALETQARELGLTQGSEQAVELPGAVGDVSEVLRSADLFVLPSREEGMSIALLEAMALGMPLVASAIPGNCCLVTDHEHGRLAPPNDPDALARTISEQWYDFDQAVCMGSAARQRIEEHFSIQMVARRHLALFEELILSRGKTVC